MSAAFHVEFWESTPSITHQTILQMALGTHVFTRLSRCYWRLTRLLALCKCV